MIHVPRQSRACESFINLMVLDLDGETQIHKISIYFLVLSILSQILQWKRVLSGWWVSQKLYFLLWFSQKLDEIWDEIWARPLFFNRKVNRTQLIILWNFLFFFFSIATSCCRPLRTCLGWHLRNTDSGWRTLRRYRRKTSMIRCCERSLRWR